jgi:hypothetical protein
VALGTGSYLEIVGPDPSQSTNMHPRWFGIDDLAAPRLATWAANADDLDTVAGCDLGGGIRLGALCSGSRRTPAGDVLSWRFTDPHVIVAGGVVPFMIEWGGTMHPSRTAARGASLLELRVEHPDPAVVTAMLARLGLDLPVSVGQTPALVARIMGMRGPVELR